MQAYFRDAVGTDLPAIGAILRGTESVEPSGSETSPGGSYRSALADIDRTDGSYVLVAEFDRQIVAVLQLLTFRHLHDRGGRTAHIVLLKVAAAYRTSGVADMIVDHAAARAIDLGCRRLVALTSTSATDEHHQWERAGFVHVDRGYVRQLG
jgi:GNAT superfamily N-acetyltransferase